MLLGLFSVHMSNHLLGEKDKFMELLLCLRLEHYSKYIPYQFIFFLLSAVVAIDVGDLKQALKKDDAFDRLTDRSAFPLTFR